MVWKVLSERQFCKLKEKKMNNKSSIKDAARVMGVDVLTEREGILAGIWD